MHLFIGLTLSSLVNTSSSVEAPSSGHPGKIPKLILFRERNLHWWIFWDNQHRKCKGQRPASAHTASSSLWVWVLAFAGSLCAPLTLTDGTERDVPQDSTFCFPSLNAQNAAHHGGKAGSGEGVMGEGSGFLHSSQEALRWSLECPSTGHTLRNEIPRDSPHLKCLGFHQCKCVFRA